MRIIIDALKDGREISLDNGRLEIEINNIPDDQQWRIDQLLAQIGDM